MAPLHDGENLDLPNHPVDDSVEGQPLQALRDPNAINQDIAAGSGTNYNSTTKFDRFLHVDAPVWTVAILLHVELAESIYI